jgi:hypothetical protein
VTSAQLAAAARIANQIKGKQTERRQQISRVQPSLPQPRKTHHQPRWLPLIKFIMHVIYAQRCPAECLIVFLYLLMSLRHSLS